MDKRQKILDTTLSLISRLGFQSTPMSLIIEKSNVAAGTIYYHFKSKEDLIDTLYSELKKEMGNAIIQNINKEISFKDKFYLIWRNLYFFFTNNSQKFEFIENYANSPFIHKEIKAITKRYYQPAIDFYKSGIKAGILRDMPIDLLVNLIFGQVSIFARMIILEEIEFSEIILEQTIQSSWDSVKIT